MAERSESSPVSCRACFYFFLIVGGSSWGLIDLAGGLFCPILLFPPLQSYWWKGHFINSRLFFQPTFQHTVHGNSASSPYGSRGQMQLAAKSKKKTYIKYILYVFMFHCWLYELDVLHPPSLMVPILLISTAGLISSAHQSFSSLMEVCTLKPRQCIGSDWLMWHTKSNRNFCWMC